MLFLLLCICIQRSWFVNMNSYTNVLNTQRGGLSFKNWKVFISWLAFRHFTPLTKGEIGSQQMAATQGSSQTFVRYYQKPMIDIKGQISFTSFLCFQLRAPIGNINVRLKYLSYRKMLKLVPFPLLVTTNNCLANKWIIVNSFTVNGKNETDINLTWV